MTHNNSLTHTELSQFFLSPHRKKDSEAHFATVVNGLDYLTDQHIMFDQVNQIKLYEPTLREPMKLNPWTKPRHQIIESCHHIHQLREFVGSVRSVDENWNSNSNNKHLQQQQTDGQSSSSGGGGGSGVNMEQSFTKFLGVTQIDDEDRFEEKWDHDIEFIQKIYRAKKNV